jgi:hypothetical protein
MDRSTIVVPMIIALAALSVAGWAQERPDEQVPNARKWSVALRVGGFSDYSQDGRFRGLGKLTGYDLSPEITGGLDVSRFIGSRGALTLSLEGLTFAGDAVVMAPTTLTYRFFFLGNGVEPAPGTSAPAVQPWIGAGVGAYAFILDGEDLTDTKPGVQMATGLLVPLSRRFDVVGELRYAAAGDARILSYTMGLGVRF